MPPKRAKMVKVEADPSSTRGAASTICRDGVSVISSSNEAQKKETHLQVRRVRLEGPRVVRRLAIGRNTAEDIVQRGVGDSGDRCVVGECVGPCRRRRPGGAANGRRGARLRRRVRCDGCECLRRTVDRRRERRAAEWVRRNRGCHLGLSVEEPIYFDQLMFAERMWSQ